mgnify:CR=1 FL=1
MNLSDISSPELNITNIDLLELLIAAEMVFVTVYFSIKSTKRATMKENDEKLKEKADLDNVKEKDSAIHNRISRMEKDHETLNKKIDSNHNLIIKMLQDINNNIMTAIMQNKSK